MKRAEIVAEARRFVEIKAKWGRMGRTEQYMDCYGMIVLLLKKFNLPYDDWTRYDLYPREDLAIKVGRHLFGEQVHPPLKDGQLVVFQIKGHPIHMGIAATDQYGRRSIIHCGANHRRCVEEAYEPSLYKQFRAAFEFIGVED